MQASLVNLKSSSQLGEAAVSMTRVYALMGKQMPTSLVQKLYKQREQANFSLGQKMDMLTEAAEETDISEVDESSQPEWLRSMMDNVQLALKSGVDTPLHAPGTATPVRQTFVGGPTSRLRTAVAHSLRFFAAAPASSSTERKRG